MPENFSNAPTPLVKWVGGKRQLQGPIISKILEVFDPKTGTYFEPFFGGGAIFFALNPRKAVASDVNSGLVNLYSLVTHKPDQVTSHLVTLENQYNKLDEIAQQKFYYDKRSLFNAKTDAGLFLNRQGLEGAALFLFLNKAGFNGMYRENATGEFNIPFGKRDRISLFGDSNINLASSALQNLEVFNQDYSETVRGAQPGDIVYFDPPYAPLSKTSSFEGYNSQNLGGFDQVGLRDLFVDLTVRNVHCIVSNSSAESIEALYADFNMEPLTASRAISASPAGRKKVKEYLIDNFEQVQR